MLILTTTTDKLQLKTSAGVNTDFYASYFDRGIGGAMGRTRGTTISATTTDIVGSPADTVVRVVKMLTVRNRHASTPQEVTIVHTDGTTAIELYTALLYAGDILQYDERSGFTVVQRVRPVATTSFAMGDWNMSVLAADVTNNNAVANTIADVTGLSFPVIAGEMYRFRFIIHYTAAATSTGSRWSVSGPGSPTVLRFNSDYGLTTTSRTFNCGLSAYDTPAASSASSAATGANIAEIDGFIQPSSSGNVIARFASEIANSAIIARTGSFVEWVRVL